MSDVVTTAAATTDSALGRWADVLDGFDRAMRLGETFVPPAIDGPEGLGPIPVELRARAHDLVAECDARAAAVRVEMAELDGELHALRGRSTPRGSWTDDAQGTTPGVGHLV